MIYSESKVRGYIVFFLIFSFLVVFTTFIFLLLNGKTISPGGEIVERGIVRINSIPENVEVYINGERKSLNGKVVQNIDLGEATITLEKDGFESWEKTINIEPGFVKDIYAQLFPTELNLQQVSTLNIDKIIYSQDGNHAYFTVLNSEIPSELGIWKVSFDSGFLNLGDSTEPNKIASLSATQINNLKENSYFLNLSRNRDRLILDIPAAEILLSYDTNANDTFEDLIDIIGFYPEKYTWFDDSKSLVIEDSNVIYELNLGTLEKDLVTIKPQDSAEELAYCVSNNRIYYVDPYSMKLNEFENGRPRIVESIPDFNPKIIKSLTCSVNNSDIAYATTTLGIYFLDLENAYSELILADEDVGVLDIGADGSVVLFATADSLYSFRIEEISSRPVYDSKLSNIGLLRPNVSAIISENGINIIYSEFDEVEEGFTVSISDTDGENITKLLRESIEPDTVSINNDGSSLHLVVDDSSSELETSKNLYRIELK